MTGQRIALTGVWLAAFVVAVVSIELYIGKPNAAGLLLLLSEDRLDAMKPVIGLYAGYLSGILAFWFLKPFKPSRNDRINRARFWIAVVCSVIFNATVLYLIARGHFTSGETVMEDIATGMRVAGLMSFLVAPVNAYYFGARAKG